jgi:hypothetical protein
MLAPRAASAGVVATRATPESSSARERVRFHTLRGKAAATRLAMGLPMFPRPRNATEDFSGTDDAMPRV